MDVLDFIDAQMESNDELTSPRLQQLIETNFGLKFSCSKIKRLRRKLGRLATPVSQQICPSPQKGPPGPNPLANMDQWGSLFASGFGLPSRIWTPRVFCHCNVSYFEYCTESVLNRHQSHLIYFKNRTKIFRSSKLRFLD
jgi:hypothetical protein